MILQVLFFVRFPVFKTEDTFSIKLKILQKKREREKKEKETIK